MGGEAEGGGGTRVERQVGRGGGERVGGRQVTWKKSHGKMNIKTKLFLRLSDKDHES